MNQERTPNALINATSPYLLQHAYNPVEWQEWNAASLERAKKEDKPILLSIGYSSCHWCHVMERESFEKDEVAEVMNKYFVCIKVDREERPDIDQIYMDAVQALGVNGGWPLNVFLTPDQKPFFGGTYFSPNAWIQVLTNIDKAFRVNRGPIEDTAEQLRIHLMRSDVERFRKEAASISLKQDLDDIFEKFKNLFDPEWGGLDKAPKFIMPSVWMWLLRYHKLTKNELALEQLVLTLKRIGMGGIYDQIGGGFARYSVDGQWFAPHFEKMLYDNAQLMSLYSEAYTVTGDPELKTIVYETLGWLLREMTSDKGGFYSAIDADSEGIEGKYYVWKASELKELLGGDNALIHEYYSLKEHGNWEHGNNILIRHRDDKTFLEGKNISPEEWTTKLSRVKQKMLGLRETRIRPSLDDKIITSWNAMMVCGLIDAYRAFGDEVFIQPALKAMHFLENELQSNAHLYRSYKDKRSAVHAFLDDYAYLILAQIKCYEVTFDESWIRKAAHNMDSVVQQFSDDTDGYFHYATQQNEKLIASKKEIFDNVIPSSNAIMAQNLFRLGIIMGRDDWKQRATRMTESFGNLIKSEPNYMSQWAIGFCEIKKGLAEVVFAGKDRVVQRQKFHKLFEPFTITLGKEADSSLPLLEGKQNPDGPATIYVCYNQSCKRPVDNVESAVKEINNFLH